MDFPIKTLDQLKPILRGFRLARGLTQKALAEQLGITQQTYAELEANPASATLGRLFVVFRLLGVEMALREHADAATAPSATEPSTDKTSNSGRKTIRGTTVKGQTSETTPPMLSQKPSNRTKPTSVKTVGATPKRSPNQGKTQKPRTGKREYLVISKKSHEAW